jgi:hypothetical protein
MLLGLLLLLSRTERFSPGMNGTSVFGLNVDGLRPSAAAAIDDAAFGYPIRRLSDIPEGDYFLQAWLNVYTTFKRADGKTVKLHRIGTRVRARNWRRSPGNLYSDPVTGHGRPCLQERAGCFQELDLLNASLSQRN